MSYVEEFRTAMRGHGLDWPGEIVGDGRIHRFKCVGDHDANSWYCLFGNGPIVAGAYGCWKRNFKENWSQKNGKHPQGKDLQALHKQWREADIQREKEEVDRHNRIAVKSSEFITPLARASRDHLYLQTKQVNIFGDLRETPEGELVLPLVDADGKLWSYQTIDVLGDKLFAVAGRVQGCFYWVNNRQDGPLVICEGYATGATIHEATGWSVACAMNCGNLKTVAASLRKNNPQRTIVIAADNDRFTRRGDQLYNPGLEKAEEAAKAINGVLTVPEFPESDDKSTDFNDLAVVHGISRVAPHFEKAFPCPMTVLSFEQIGQIPVNDQDKLLGDHLLDCGGCLVVAGQGGTGKSRMIYQMLAAFNSGAEKFLTLDIHPGARNLRCLVLQKENGVLRLKDERTALRAMLGSRWNKFNSLVHVLTPVTEIDGFLNLDQPENLLRLQRVIEHIMPDLIIFDSLYDFGVGDLNKDQDMRASLTAISRLAKHRNPRRATIILHHSLTGQTGAAKAVGYDRASFARNSKVLYNWTRAQINLAPISEDSNNQLAISCAKCSDGREFLPFAVNLNEETMIYEVDPQVNVVEWAKQVRSGKRGDPLMRPDRVRELCEVSGSTKVQISKAVIDDCGCVRQSAYRHVKQAEVEGKIKWSSDQGRYFRS